MLCFKISNPPLESLALNLKNAALCKSLTDPILKASAFIFFASTVFPNFSKT
jgi:hypothetical protein